MRSRRPHRASIAQIRALAQHGHDPFQENPRAADAPERTGTAQVSIHGADVILTFEDGEALLFDPATALAFAMEIARAAHEAGAAQGLALEARPI